MAPVERHWGWSPDGPLGGATSLDTARTQHIDWIFTFDRERELAADRARLRERLDQLHAVELQRPNPGPLDVLPVGPCDLDALPDDIARCLFEALRLHHRTSQRRRNLP